MSNNKAIGAHALGGEADTIAVVSPSLRRDSSTTMPQDDAAAPAAAPTAMMTTTPSSASASASDPNPKLSSASATSTTGLHSPPDSNNATKLDGSSDSELSDLDDDVLAESFHPMPSDNAADAPGTSAMTPSTTAADALHSSDHSAASSTGPDASAPAPDAPAEVDDIGDIEPDHYSGTVPVFRPTMHQFRDFKKFMEKVDTYGMKSGIIKIIPPQEWKDSLGPLDEKVKSIKVREPIKQDIMGSSGTYRQVNILHQRTYNLPQWKALCDQSEHQPPARRGERRANADKPKPASTRARAAAAPATASGAAAGKKGKKGRGGRRGARNTADDDNASVLSEPRPLTPESQRGDDDKMALDDDKTCVATPEDVEHHQPGDKDDDDHAVLSSVEVEIPIKKEDDEDEDDSRTVDSSMTDIPAAPRRMGGFARQPSSNKTQSTSARRKYIKREATAKIDEAAFKDWDYRMDVSDYTPERCEELERIYWKTLTYAPPLYGADLPGTLFDESTEEWNLNKLPNLLDVLGTKVPGVNTAYLYLGMWKATFAWHLEDVDLYSINYLHFGAPKQWYSISQGDARRFEAAMKNIWPADAKACAQFLRHKAFLISPAHLLSHYNIRVNKCVSYPGEFVVTYPYGYHSGYNLGYNCAEAVNFALESWLPMGKIAKKCECAQAQDSVWVDVYEIERKLRGISTDNEEFSEEDEEEDDDDDDDDEDDDESGEDVDDDNSSVNNLPTPPSGGRSVRLQLPAGRKRKRASSKPVGKRSRARIDCGANSNSNSNSNNSNSHSNSNNSNSNDINNEQDSLARRRLKKMRMRLRSGGAAPCCLCPNNTPEAELLPTDDGRQAHRMCAMYLPETFIESVDGKEVVTNVANIPLFRLELRCMYCRLRKGVCLQCSYAKCSRSYHATCAAAAGVFVEEVEVPVFGDDGTEYKERAYEFTCRFQRTKRDKKLDSLALERNERIRTAAAALKTGAVCQMQLYRSDIFAGIVLENRADEETVLLRIIPSNDVVEVNWKWLLLPDPSDYRLPKASAHALPLPTSRKEIEGLNVKKRPYPLADDVFVEGYTWKEFHICEGSSFVSCTNQARVDLAKPDQMWHYMGAPSTDSKAQYTGDVAHPVHNAKSNFLDSLPKPVLPTPTAVAVSSSSSSSQPAMLPPKRPAAAPVSASPVPVPGQTTATTAATATTFVTSMFAPSPATAESSSSAAAAEPRRSYSVIKPPYVPHTSPTTSTTAAPPAGAATTPATATASAAPAPAAPPRAPDDTPTTASTVSSAPSPSVPSTASTAFTVPATPTHAAAPPAATPSSASPTDVAAAFKYTKTADGFVQPQLPASRQGHRPQNNSSASASTSTSTSTSSSSRGPFGSFFAMPAASGGSGSSKFPQIQHPNLSHGYATVSAGKSASGAGGSGGGGGGAMSPPPTNASGAETNSEAKARAISPPRPPNIPTTVAKKFAFFQEHGNKDAGSYRSPYMPGTGINAAFASSVSKPSQSRIVRGPSRSRKSSVSGAAALAAAAAKLHKRSASSTNSVSSFGLGGGLSGLSRPSAHTNYVGPPPAPSSTASSPFFGAFNNTSNRPGSSVSSYASYESYMGGGMSPHSPRTVDASPFVGSPGPQLGAFDYQPSASAYHHPGMRPQFGASWQHNFHAPMGSFSQDMDMDFSPPSPMSTAMSLPGGGSLGAAANIIPGGGPHPHHHHHHSFSFGDTGTLGPDSLLTSGLGSGMGGGGFGSMSPSLVQESPLAMSPTMDMEMEMDPPVEPGVDLSPADQLKQQLRSISDSSLPSSYRLRCLHQPRRRHQSRSSLNRIFTSQLLDLNPT